MSLFETAHLHDPNHQLPLAGYAGLVGIFSTTLGTILGALPARKLRLTPADVLLLGIGTFQLTRILAKDRVLAPFRAPFTKHRGSAGAGEVTEEARGSGVKKAIGELITCPYCLAPWVSSALSVSLALAPKKTRWLAGILSIAACSDVAQQLYAGLRRLSA